VIDDLFQAGKAKMNNKFSKDATSSVPSAMIKTKITTT
jgi:hypothetical protein